MAHDSSSYAPDLWSSLETLVRVRTYDVDAVLFEQGQPADGVYLIQRGKVRLWMPRVALRMMKIDPAGVGSMLGLSETIAHGAHKLSATALVTSEIGFVPGEVLMSFLRDHNDICLQVVRLLSEDLHVLHHQFQALKTHARNRRWQGNPDVS